MDNGATRSYSIYSPSEKLIAIFGACSLLLATIEFLFPRPLPYMRLGLANIPIIVSLRIFPIRYIYLLAFLKVCAQGILHGTFASYVILFSLCGTLASVTVMIILQRVFPRSVSLVGVSLLGALFSSTTQAMLAIGYIFGSNALLILPLICGNALLGGLFVGICSEYFWHRSAFLQCVRRSEGAKVGTTLHAS